MSNRIMFDIETLDTKRSAVVLTVGYAIFGKEKIVASGQAFFNVQKQLDAGRTVSWKTLEFWFKQIALHPELVKPFINSVPNPPSEYQYWLHQLLGKSGEDQMGPEIEEVWANGPEFDLGILKNLFYETMPYSASCPWQFYQERDYRTFIKQAQLAGIVLPERPRDLPLHDAESDARYQAEMVLYVEQVHREAMHALAVGAHRSAKAVGEFTPEGVETSLTPLRPENEPAENLKCGFTDTADEEMHEVDFEEVPYREPSVSDYVDHHIKDNDDGTFSVKPIASVEDDGKPL